MTEKQGLKRPSAALGQLQPKKQKFVMTNELRMKKQLHIGSNELGYQMKANYIHFNAINKIFDAQLFMVIKKKITSRLIAMYAEGETFRLTCDLTYAYRKIYPITTDAELIRQAVEELKKRDESNTFQLTDEHLQIDDGSPEITEKLFNESPAAKELDDEMYFTKEQLSRAVDLKSNQIAEKFKQFLIHHQPNRRTPSIEEESLRVVDCMLHKMKNDFKGIVRSALFGISARQLNDVIGRPVTIYFEPRMVSREIRSDFLNSMGAVSVQLPRTVHNLALAQFDNLENFSNMLRANGTMLGGSRLVVRGPQRISDQTADQDRNEQGEGDTTQDFKKDTLMDDRNNSERNDEEDEVLHAEEY